MLYENRAVEAVESPLQQTRPVPRPLKSSTALQQLYSLYSHTVIQRIHHTALYNTPLAHHMALTSLRGCRAALLSPKRPAEPPATIHWEPPASPGRWFMITQPSHPAYSLPTPPSPQGSKRCILVYYWCIASVFHVLHGRMYYDEIRVYYDSYYTLRNTERNTVKYIANTGWIG